MTFGQTLGAVAAGGFITLISQLALEAWRELRHRKQVTESNEVEARVAARLIILDLISMMAMLQGAGETFRWWTRLQLPMVAWNSHAQALSRTLPDAIWRTVGSTFAGAETWNEFMRASRVYYWVMPHLNLRRFGLLTMREELQNGAAEGIRILLPLAMPTVTPDDPLYKRAQQALHAADH